MRLGAWLLALAACPACTDELSLRAVVTHPPEAAVATTVIAVYESNTTTCTQIQFGDLSTSQLSSILVAELAIDASGAAISGSLDGLSRVDRKLVVARGFDAQGRFLTAGCTAKELVTGHDVVDVATDFAATLSIGALPLLETGIPIALTDAEGRSLAGHPVSWRVYGPDGAEHATTAAALAPSLDASWELAAPACSGAAGVVRLHPVPPSRVGGFAIELRPSWPAQAIARLTSFTKIDPTQLVITPNPNATRPCALRVSGGTRRLACLQLSATNASIVREYEVAVTAGNARLQLRDTAPIDAGAIALISIARGADRDVYAITDRAEVLGVFGPSLAPTSGPHLAAGLVTDALLQPACDAGQPEQLLLRIATVTERRLEVMPPLGGPLAKYHNVTAGPLLQLAVRGTGCIAELQPGGGAPARRQAAIVERGVQGGDPGSRVSTQVHFTCGLQDQAQCKTSLPVPGAGAGLSGGSLAEEPRLTGMFLDATGVVMSSWVLLPNGAGEFLLVERGRVPAASIPNRVVTGSFDGDGRADLFWDLPSLTQPTSNFQATYARTIGDQRLSALSGAEPLQVDDLLTAPVTGDDTDDVVIYGRQRTDDGLGNVTTTTGIVVIPMNVSAPSPVAMADQPCP